jgi:hypothetical protein
VHPARTGAGVTVSVVTGAVVIGAVVTGAIVIGAVVTGTGGCSMHHKDQIDANQVASNRHLAL